MIHSLLIAASLGVLSLGAVEAAPTYPDKPITLLIPYPPGGSADMLARPLGAELHKKWGQPVVLEYKPGAGGAIASAQLARAKPDGYTLLLGTIATHAINPSLLPGINYNAAKDFAPVILLGSISNVLLVGASQPYKSVQDVVAAGKANPDTIAFGSAGQGTSQHLSGEVFKQLTGAHLTHVPYRGSAPAIQDLIGGQIPSSFETALVALPYVQSGKVRALAVTSAKRTEVMPDVPTMQEAGVAGFDVSSWQAIYAPANTPPAVVDRLNKAIAAIIAKPDVNGKMKGLGLAYTPNTPAEFTAFQAGEQAKWAKIIADGKLRVQ